MLCEIHGDAMDWVPVEGMPAEFPGGGYWSCDQCVVDEEEWIESNPDPEDVDFG